MNTEKITTVTRNLIEALCLPAWRWLTSIASFLSDRFAKAKATAQVENSVSTRCGADLPASDQETVAIMLNAINVGLSRSVLTRAAMPAAEAVLPLTGQWQVQATAVIDAAEAWANHPNTENAKAVSLAREALISRCGGKWGNGDIVPNNEFALMAVVAVALTCGFEFGFEALVALAVKFSGQAAGDDFDLAPLVAAALL
jgi:hypothetical protein